MEQRLPSALLSAHTSLLCSPQVSTGFWETERTVRVSILQTHAAYRKPGPEALALGQELYPSPQCKPWLSMNWLHGILATKLSKGLEFSEGNGLGQDNSEKR